MKKNGQNLLSFFFAFAIKLRPTITCSFIVRFPCCLGGVLGVVMGTNWVTISFWQAMAWLHYFLPFGAKFYLFIIVAIYWVIWNVHNKVTFD
jgi:hypothetical protein